MLSTLRARSTPYPPALKSGERICTRCGILFRFNISRSKPTECRDCRAAA